MFLIVTASHPVLGGGGRGVPLWLQGEQATNALAFGLAQFSFLIESALLASGLVEEHVIVVRFASHDLPRARDLKPLRRRLAGLQL